MEIEIKQHKCPEVDNTELENLRTELQAKDHKITKLEKEIKALKDKPPVQPTDSEKEAWLTILQEKEKFIQELKTELQAQPKEVIKEVENLTTIQELKTRLAKQEKKIEQLHLVYLALLGLSFAVSVGLARKGGLKKIKKN